MRGRIGPAPLSDNGARHPACRLPAKRRIGIKLRGRYDWDHVYDRFRSGDLGGSFDLTAHAGT